MSRRLHIARDGLELGSLGDMEARELLRAGFLRSTDLYWVAGMKDWKPLSEIESLPAASKPSPLLNKAKQMASSTAAAISRGASAMPGKFKALAQSKPGQLADSTRRMLEDFAPQIQTTVSRQLVGPALSKAREAIHDEQFMRKTFGAVYDCIPKPARRFVSEDNFVAYCLQHRRRLLDLD